MVQSQGFMSKTLDEQIDSRRTEIHADKLDVTYGEFTNMYKADELTIRPDFQRLFRWTISQKTRFIESILLGIPTPAIFVAEDGNGVWELVDGLQRLSTMDHALNSANVIVSAETHAATVLLNSSESQNRRLKR